MWEAFEHAAHFELDNLTAIIDVNRLGQRGETMVGWNLDTYARARRGVRLERDRGRRPRRRRDRRGVRPRGLDDGEADGRDRTHAEGKGRGGRGEPERLARQAARGPRRRDRRARRPARHPYRGREARQSRLPPAAPSHRSSFLATSSEPRSRRGRRTATRSQRSEQRGQTSWRSTARYRTRPSPRPSRRHIPSGTSRCTSPSSRWSRRPSACRRSAGARSPRRSPRSSRGRTTSSAWRRSAARRFSLSGSHAGVSIGEDGPSQMALEDIASIRAIHGSTVLHPCDANQTARLVAAMAETDGISYLRTLRPATPVLYSPDEEFEIGGSRVLRSSDEDEVAIVAAGITVHEALEGCRRARRGGNRRARHRPLLDQAARRATRCWLPPRQPVEGS